jgi:hypothetical protein
MILDILTLFLRLTLVLAFVNFNAGVVAAGGAQIKSTVRATSPISLLVTV